MEEYADLIGCKFKIHGRTKEEGLDCYGLAIEVLRRNGITLPDLWYDEETFSCRENLHFTLVENYVEKVEKLEKNCIIEIKIQGLPKHIGVYIGNGKMIHTLESVGVCIVPVSKYKHCIMGYLKVKSNS